VFEDQSAKIVDDFYAIFFHLVDPFDVFVAVRFNHDFRQSLLGRFGVDGEEEGADDDISEFFILHDFQLDQVEAIVGGEED
jgi:hypothetical protein